MHLSLVTAPDRLEVLGAGYVDILSLLEYFSYFMMIRIFGEFSCPGFLVGIDSGISIVEITAHPKLYITRYEKKQENHGGYISKLCG